MGVQFDKRTGLRILNAVKQVEGGSPHYTCRPMNPKRPGGGGGANSVAVIVHGPAASDVSAGTYTLTLSECTIIQGTIPDDVTTITANDTHAWGIEEDQLVWVILPVGDEVGVDNFLTYQAGCPPEEP